MAFKIGKKAKAEPVNPFRPNYGLPSRRNFTVCRFTDWTSKLGLLDTAYEHWPVMIDCDAEELFIREMVYIVPKSEIWHDKDHEVYRVAHKWFDKLIDIATDYFDEVKVERGGKVEVVRSPTRVDLINRDGTPYRRENGK